MLDGSLCVLKIEQLQLLFLRRYYLSVFALAFMTFDERYVIARGFPRCCNGALGMGYIEGSF